MKRQDVVNELNKFYELNGITPDDKFHCEKNNICGSKNIELAQGMQCHIGTQYNEKAGIKVLVVSIHLQEDETH